MSPDATTGSPLGILPDLGGDPTVVVFTLADPFPDAEDALGGAALCGGARPSCSCTGLGTGVLDLVWEDGGPFLTGSDIVFYLVCLCCGDPPTCASVEFLS